MLTSQVSLRVASGPPQSVQAPTLSLAASAKASRLLPRGGAFEVLPRRTLCGDKGPNATTDPNPSSKDDIESSSLLCGMLSWFCLANPLFSFLLLSSVYLQRTSSRGELNLAWAYDKHLVGRFVCL